MSTRPLLSTRRLAGLLYLVPMLLGPFSMLHVPSAIVVPGDAAATIRRLVASKSLLRLGMLSDAVIVLTELVLSAVLYALLKPGGGTLARIATLAGVAMAAVQAVNLLPWLMALRLARSDTAGAGEVDTLVLSLLELHADGAHVWGALFGLHCLAAGLLIGRSGVLPRVFGPLLCGGAGLPARRARQSCDGRRRERAEHDCGGDGAGG